MSGGVGPTSNDISLPEDDQEQEDQLNPKTSLKSLQAPRHPGILNFRQLNALAVIIVFSASGLVSLADTAFVIFSLVYMYFISKVAFPKLHPSKEPTVFNPKNRILQFYVLMGAIVGLFLPIAYICEGIYEGEKEGIKAAVPHVFLLASQVFMEGIAFSGSLATPIRVFVPVFYNSRRIFTIVEWLRSEVSNGHEEHGGSFGRVYFGKALAIANMAFWSFNLFGFLLPVYLPRAFKMYYSENKKLKD